VTSIPDEVWAKIVEESGNLECPVCHRLLRDHAKEESIEHLRQDVKIELDIACLTEEQVKNLKPGAGEK
jgi:C4-type Zn-finger protein